jgi:hypothetical protein
MFLNLSSLLTKANFTYSIVYEQLLVQLGSTYLIDTIYSISSCVSFVGLCLNLITIRVLLGEQFKTKKLFDYMRVYLINSATISFLMLPAFLLGRRFAFANAPYGTLYACYIYGPLVTVCYAFSALLDIAIVSDRLTLFTKKFDFVKKYSVRSVCAVSFGYSLLVGLMFYAFYYPGTLVAYLSETNKWRFYFLKPTQLLKSPYGLLSILFCCFF